MCTWRDRCEKKHMKRVAARVAARGKPTLARQEKTQPTARGQEAPADKRAASNARYLRHRSIQLRGRVVGVDFGRRSRGARGIESGVPLLGTRFFHQLR